MKIHTLLFSLFVIQGMTQTTVADSIIIEANLFRHAPKAHSIQLIDLHQTTDWNTALRYQSAITIKEYGAGMLSTISYRGLGAAHTAVLWEGLPLNSSLSGVTDWSIVPYNSQATVALRSGGGVSNSGAMGGQLAFNYKPIFEENNYFKINQSFGSFNYKKTSFEGYFATQNWTVQTGLDYKSATNDYTYLNDTQIVKNGDYKLAQTFANLAYRNAKHIISYNTLNSWADKGIIDFYNYAPQQAQQDRLSHHRIAWTYASNTFKQSFIQGILTNTYRYFFDRQIKNSFDSGTALDFISQYQAQYRINPQLNLWGQAQFQTTQAFGSSYAERYRLNQGIFDLGVSYKIKNLTQELQLSKGLSNLFSIPLAVDYALKWGKSDFFGYINGSHNYRNPTLNDLYYKYGGNSALKAEKGWNTELGFYWKKDFGSISWRSNQQFYYGRYRDFIQWIPSSQGANYYQPANVDRVMHYGFVFNPAVQYKFFKWCLNISTTATYTIIKNTETDKRLSYAPKYKWSGIYSIIYQKNYLQLEQELTKGSYADNAESMPNASYINYNLVLGIPLFKEKTKIVAGIRNLLNKENYIIQQNYLPGRNYYLELRFSF